MSEWAFPEATKDGQGITKDWDFVGRTLIDGVSVKEIKNVPAGYGHLTEIFRSEWFPENVKVDQVFQSVLDPGKVSAWHAHEHTTDRLFIAKGMMLVVLFDGREDSPTYGMINDFRLSTLRPATVVVPPKVWHGIRNIGQESSILINLVDQAYRYDGPDHWRVAPDSPRIPYQILR